jgi:hypothetical protein
MLITTCIRFLVVFYFSPISREKDSTLAAKNRCSKQKENAPFLQQKERGTVANHYLAVRVYRAACYLLYTI